MTIPSIREFEAKGWFLSQEGIDRIHAENKSLNSIQDYINCAKWMDLHLLTTKGFDQPLKGQLPSPFILQVVSIQRKKVAAATKNSGGLTIVFTDGHNEYKAAEILGKVECIKPHTPPGTKFLVDKPIEIRDQVLVLGPGMLKEEGGLVKAKKMSKKPAKKLQKRNTSETTAVASRETTPGLLETSQKKKKTRKPRKKASLNEEIKTQVDNIKKLSLKPVVKEEHIETTTTTTPSDISPISENKPIIHNYIPPPLPLPLPPQEYYYPAQPMYAPYIDYSMMVPVVPNTMYMPPQYIQPVYYQPQYYTYPPHYTQLYDESHYGQPYQ